MSSWTVDRLLRNAALDECTDSRSVVGGEDQFHVELRIRGARAEIDGDADAGIRSGSNCAHSEWKGRGCLRHTG